MTSEATTPWALPIEKLADELQADLHQGLEEATAEERLQQTGPNEIAAGSRHHPALMILRQFADLMIGLLAVAAVISALIGEWIDTVLIGLIVIANAIIGFAQEWKAERAVEALKKLSQPMASVRRNGRTISVPARDLVPGDVIEIKAGDYVPADARLISAATLEIDESPLTGESLPIEKTPAPISADSLLPDRACMIHSGTAVVHGRGAGLITATGQKTELGKVASLLESAEAGQTPLQRRLANMNRWLAIAVVIISLVVFAAGILREPVSEWNRQLYSGMLLTAVSLAVAAIPEGLPAVITVTLALGSQRMARRKAIVRRLAAVEALGSVNVICSDKTGTLTQNRMKVEDLVPARSGPEGERKLLEAAALCNDARQGKGNEIIGSATEAALLSVARNSGIDIDVLLKNQPRIAEIPFSSERKLMTTVHQYGKNRKLTIVKGASDYVLKLCESTGDLTPEDWSARVEQLTHKGRRVLAVAARVDDASESHQEPRESSLELLGLVGIVDPVRPEARDAIVRCKEAGIRPVMITGDHPGTAQAIADELRLMDSEYSLVTGAELQRLADEDLASRASSIGCYARVSPEHKLRIVRAHQSQGLSVAMTGDGVNDAPALKQADVGVAMGMTGTDVSKEAAEIILADDNFATIVAAIEEGRVVYDNIRKFVCYLLTANASEVMVLLGSIVMGLPLPLLPVHLLWINLVTDSLPALALGFERPERDVMNRPPRRAGESLFSGKLSWGIVAGGLLMATSCLILFVLALNQSDDPSRLQRARTLIFFSLAVSQLFYVCGLRSFRDSLWRLGLWSNYRLTVAVLVGIGLQIATMYVPVLQRFFHTVAPSLYELTIALLFSAVPLIAVETWKFGRRLREDE